jgi:hypothetical protein
MQTSATNQRRDFFKSLAVGTALGLPAILSTLSASANPHELSENNDLGDADAWFKKIKGKHRICYDASEPHGGMPIIWNWVFYTTNNQTGTPDNDMTGMVVLRHNAIPFAMKDELWSKYKLGEVFNVTDNNTGKPALRNTVWAPVDKDFPMSAIEGIQKLIARGGLFCVCDMALTVYSGVVAGKMGLNAEVVKKEWVSGIHEGIQIVPSGVWAIGRAQENGCGYCYAGG